MPESVVFDSLLILELFFEPFLKSFLELVLLFLEELFLEVLFCALNSTLFFEVAKKSSVSPESTLSALESVLSSHIAKPELIRSRSLSTILSLISEGLTKVKNKVLNINVRHAVKTRLAVFVNWQGRQLRFS